MAITVNWITKVIDMPQIDLTLITGTLFELNTEVQFRQALNALMASEEGIVFEDPVRHNTQVTVAGTTFARTIEIINGYSIEFTPNNQFSVRLAGSNNNLFDVENSILVQNQVQIIGQNSGGLIVTDTSGLTVDEAIKLDEMHKLQGLDISNPMTVTPTSRDAGSISQTITGDGTTTSTVTRDS